MVYHVKPGLSHAFHARPPPKYEKQLRKNHVSYTKITFHMITDKKLALKEAIVTNNNISNFVNYI